MDAPTPRFSLAPFTMSELLDALALVVPAGLVGLYRRDMADRPDTPGTASVTDGMLLILAAVSEGHAARVAEHRPDLREQVRAARADPAGFLESERMRWSEDVGDS